MKKIIVMIPIIFSFSLIKSSSQMYKERYNNYALTTGNKRGVAVIGYNRPDYFKQTLASLEQNPESQTVPFFFFLDGGPKSKQQEYIDMINRSSIRNKNIIAHSKNIGCEINSIDALKFMFDVCKFDIMFHFEDDQVVAPDYIQFLDNLYRWSNKQYDNVGIVQGWSMCLLSKQQKQKYLNSVEETVGMLWGYCMDRQVWKKIRILTLEYERRFLKSKDYYYKSYPKQRIWKYKESLKYKKLKKDARIVPLQFSYKKFFKYSQSELSQDIFLMLALYKNGLVRLAPVVNRAINVGARGLHFSDIYYYSAGFGNMKLDVFDSYKIKNFQLNTKKPISSKHFIVPLIGFKEWIGKS